MSVTVLKRGVSSESLFWTNRFIRSGTRQNRRLMAWFPVRKGLILDSVLDVEVRIQFKVVFVAHVSSLARMLVASNYRIQFAVRAFVDGGQDIPW